MTFRLSHMISKLDHMMPITTQTRKVMSVLIPMPSRPCTVLLGMLKPPMLPLVTHQIYFKQKLLKSRHQNVHRPLLSIPYHHTLHSPHTQRSHSPHTHNSHYPYNHNSHSPHPHKSHSPHLTLAKWSSSRYSTMLEVGG